MAWSSCGACGMHPPMLRVGVQCGRILSCMLAAPPFMHKEEHGMGNSTLSRASLVLLLVPFIGLLWVSSYNKTTPELFGFPFFYWYLLLWLPLSTIITAVVYLANRK